MNQLLTCTANRLAGPNVCGLALTLIVCQRFLTLKRGLWGCLWWPGRARAARAVLAGVVVVPFLSGPFPGQRARTFPQRRRRKWAGVPSWRARAWGIRGANVKRRRFPAVLGVFGGSGSFGLVD
jgi:hypothetical protein